MPTPRLPHDSPDLRSPPSEIPKVAVIVLNYNGKDVTLASLASLAQMRYPNFDLIVVDNGSTDGSFVAVAQAFPQVVQLRVEPNQGISNGLNFGLRHALAQDYGYFLVLNNDIEVDPDLLREMVAVAVADPTIGCVGPKAYYFWDRARLWSTGGILRFFESVTRERGDGELDLGQYDRDEEVDYVNGCALLKRREALVKTGLWDPVYFLGIEDADWCVRMKQQGYRCFYAHRARLWHMISQTTGGYRAGRTFHTGRSSAIFVRKYARPWQKLTFALGITLALPLAFLRELRRGNQQAVVAKLRGILSGLQVPLPPPPEALP